MVKSALYILQIVLLLIVTGCSGQFGISTSFTATPSEPTKTLVPTPSPVVDLPADGIAEFHILHWNDFHDELIERYTEWGMWVPGAARLSAFVKAERDKYGINDIIVLDAGDWLHGDNVPDQSRGERMVEFYSKLGVDAITLGNHELNFGATRLLELLNQTSKINVLNINFQKTNSEGKCTTKHLTDAYKIFVMGEPQGPQVRVAVIGETAAHEELDIQSPPPRSPVCFSEPLQKIIDIYDTIKNVEKADVIILLTHQGINVDKEMAQQLIDAGTPVDFIIGGHQDYGNDEPIMIGNTYIFSVEDHGTEVGVIDVAYNRKTAEMDVNWRQEAFTPDSPEDPEILAMLRDLIPTPTVMAPGVYLANLQPSKVSVGYWTLGTGMYPPNSDFQGETIISAHGRTYPLGFFAHAPSELVFDLDGKYSTFRTEILLKESTNCSDGAVFSVIVDGEEVFLSDRVFPLEEPTLIVVDISGGSEIKLLTTEGKTNNCDWAIWGDPYLEY